MKWIFTARPVALTAAFRAQNCVQVRIIQGEHLEPRVHPESHLEQFLRRGQHHLKRALEVAAAGCHNLCNLRPN